MINLLSIKCSLAFAPYIAESTAEFISAGLVTTRVVRQGGSGLILRSDGEVVMRHNNRQAELAFNEARHYCATVRLRHQFYQVHRLEDEVVMANVGNELLLSHPQSELWLTKAAIVELLRRFGAKGASTEPAALTEWLTLSAGAGSLLLSDQRTGRWVLLSDDHMRELERRLPLLTGARGDSALPPPTISVKNITVHLQSASTLAEALEDFVATGRFEPFIDLTPGFSLSVREATEGIEIADQNSRVGLTAKEARKWSEIIRRELARLNCSTMTRGKIRTVFADAETGRWVLQCGDEVLVPHYVLAQTRPSDEYAKAESLEVKREDGLLVLLLPETGACVALEEKEVARLIDAAAA